MKKAPFLTLLATFIVFGAAGSAFGQIASGGTYSLDKAVVGGGGGTSAGGSYTVDGTAGQTAAGNASGGAYSVNAGFWTPSASVPTAAGVTIEGRVRIPGGRGLRNAVVTLVDANGLTRTTRTGTAGYFRFEDLASGQTVIVNVKSRTFQFAPQVVTLLDNVGNLDFTGTAASTMP